MIPPPPKPPKPPEMPLRDRTRRTLAKKTKKEDGVSKTKCNARARACACACACACVRACIPCRLARNVWTCDGDTDKEVGICNRILSNRGVCLSILSDCQREDEESDTCTSTIQAGRAASGGPFQGQNVTRTEGGRRTLPRERSMHSTIEDDNVLLTEAYIQQRWLYDHAVMHVRVAGPRRRRRAR